MSYLNHTRKQLTCLRKSCGRRLLVSLILSIVVLATYTIRRYDLLTYIPLQNGECYLTSQQQYNLRHTLRHVIATFEDMNVTYWLDQGTLVGALRTGDIMSHDTDGDIGLLINNAYKPKEVQQRLKEHGIGYRFGINYFARAKYNDMWVDVIRWKTVSEVFDGKMTQMLRKDFSGKHEMQRKFITKFIDKEEEFPLSWLHPTRIIDFMDVRAKIPNMAESLIRHRYPFTHKFSVPYKWKCWLPQR